ncbi:MAG: hypothetical protein ACKPFF_38775 [Planktothrix sp.]
MAIFRLEWLDGTNSLVEGNSFNEAFISSYGAGAMKALDYWKEIPLIVENWILEKSVPAKALIRDIYIYSYPGKEEGDERIEMIKMHNLETGETSEGNIRLR